MLNNLALSGRRFSEAVIMISGVSDRGIGGAIAERLGEEGASIVALWHQQRPERTLRRLQRQNTPHLAVECDVTSQSSVEAAIATCLASFGRVDVLVNNAGVETACELQSATDEQWQQTLDVNLTGAMRLTRAVLPELSTDGGVIVNISSVLAMAGAARYSAYAASKAGLIGMTQSLAIELAPHGQRVVCLAPALVHTPMIHKHLCAMTEEERQQSESMLPLGIGQPQDVAAAVAFLASDDARWISGVTLPMGWLNGYAIPQSRRERSAAHVEVTLNGAIG